MGGSDWNGARDWTSSQYGPGGSCIDTTHPFEVAISFPIGRDGLLMAMEVVLSQVGSPCTLNVSIADYDGNTSVADRGKSLGMHELTQALRYGMTPIVSYWRSDDMHWMDGKGQDGLGPCENPYVAPSCPESVPFYNFSIEPIPLPSTPDTTDTGSVIFDVPFPDTCPGAIDLNGYGPISLVATKWNVPGDPASKVEVVDGKVVPQMKGRSYFADMGQANSYDHNNYVALNLLGKTLQYTTDLSGVGCGCNVAVYLTSLQQNTDLSGCYDYYCDANSVCGVPCAEIDLQEANQVSWHSTLHTANDRYGKGAGYGGGGDDWNGARDWTSSQYGPGGFCVDTTHPFEVAISFPIGRDGLLMAMEVVLSQVGSPCTLNVSIADYDGNTSVADQGKSLGMHELTQALRYGMTPIVSYWRSDDMHWMDGKGQDGLGPCEDPYVAPSCPESVPFYNFSIESIPLPSTPDITDTGSAIFDVPFPDTCPGAIDLNGYGPISLVATKWNVPGDPASKVEVVDGKVVPQMKGRSYFADVCQADSYDHNNYV